MATRILVVSGNSSVGAETVRQLLAQGVPVRAGVRNTAKAGELQKLGAEVVAADLEQPETLQRALAGIERVLLATAADPGIAALHGRLYAAAREAAVRQVVRVSAVEAAVDSPITLGRSHGEAERGLEASGLAWTHLRPHSFMQNLLGSAAAIVRTGKLYSSMGDGRIPHVDLRDIAAVAAACLTQPGHAGKSYEVTGPEALTMDEVAAQLGAAAGRRFEHVNIPPEDWAAALIAAGLPEWGARDLAWLHTEVFARGHASKVSTAVRDVTGREGIRFAQFARDHAHLFGRAATA